MQKYISFFVAIQAACLSVLVSSAETEPPPLITPQHVEQIFGKKIAVIKNDMLELENQLKRGKIVTFVKGWESRPLPYALPTDVSKWAKSLDNPDESTNNTILRIGETHRLLTFDEWRDKVCGGEKMWPKEMVDMKRLEDEDLILLNTERQQGRHNYKTAYQAVFRTWKSKTGEDTGDPEYSQKVFANILEWADKNRNEPTEAGIEGTYTVGERLLDIITTFNSWSKEQWSRQLNIPEDELEIPQEFFGVKEGDNCYLFNWGPPDVERLIATNLEKLEQKKRDDHSRASNVFFRLIHTKEVVLSSNWFYKIRAARSNETLLETYAQEVDSVIDKRDVPAIIKFYQDGAKLESIPEEWKTQDDAFKYLATW